MFAQNEPCKYAFPSIFSQHTLFNLIENVPKVILNHHKNLTNFDPATHLFT